MTYARRAWIIFYKDLLVERRSKEQTNALLFFCLLLLFLFQFALGPDRDRLAAALPGLLWLGFILAGLLGLGRSFLAERENDCWEGLRLTPGDKSAIYLGKLAGNCVLMTAVEIILVVLFGVFYDVDLWTPAAPLALVLALGTIGLAAVVATHSFGGGLGVADRVAILGAGRLLMDRPAADLAPEELHRLYESLTDGAEGGP